MDCDVLHVNIIVDDRLESLHRAWNSAIILHIVWVESWFSFASVILFLLLLLCKFDLFIFNMVA